MFVIYDPLQKSGAAEVRIEAVAMLDQRVFACRCISFSL